MQICTSRKEVIITFSSISLQMTKFNESNLKFANQNYLNDNICVRCYTKNFIIQNFIIHKARYHKIIINYILNLHIYEIKYYLEIINNKRKKYVKRRYFFLKILQNLSINRIYIILYRYLKYLMMFS